MAFRTRRQARYLRLRNSGFLPFEARALSRVPTKICPYMRQLIVERLEYLRAAQESGATKTQYEDKVKRLYKDEKWLRAGKIRVDADPWKMLRDYEERWRVKNPQYTSPWEKKWRDWQDFQRKLENTMRKQRGLA